MDNYILIGMPGCGKSTVGVVLAKALRYEFIDTDLLIQKREKALLSEVMGREGIDGFIGIENDVIKSLDLTECVIATGGSAVYGKEAMRHLKRIGKVIYLRLPYQVIRRRLGNLKRRGVVLRQGQTLYDLYQERCPLYEQYADMVINADHGTIRQTVEKILRVL